MMELITNKVGSTIIKTPKPSGVVSIPEPVAPVYSKTEFFDKLGNGSLLAFINLLDAGDSNAKLFDYRLSQTNSVDMAHEVTLQGLDYLISQNVITAAQKAVLLNG